MINKDRLAERVIRLVGLIEKDLESESDNKNYQIGEEINKTIKARGFDQIRAIIRNERVKNVK